MQARLILLGLIASQLQADRLQAAQSLADKLACTVILKGSGSIIASPGALPAINPTGDARLATAGTGDILAGICGAFLAQEANAVPAARRACWAHGALVGDAATSSLLVASGLITRLSQR
jgi:ADP-dependent NAD(P)H-hydrate dehydratase / NAD(P)H-hydrate epimerase